MRSRAGSARWVVPYADLVTLLFALFAMLYAMSALDRERLAGVADGLRSAFGSGAAGPLAVPVAPEPAGRAPRLHDLDEQLERLSRELQRRLGDGASVSLQANGLHVAVAGPGFTSEGGSELSKPARALLAETAPALRGYPGPLHVVARGAGWALATARAAAAVRDLAAHETLPAVQLYAVGRTAGDAQLALWLPREFMAPEPAVGESETLRRLLDQLPPPAEAPDAQAADSPSGAGGGSGSRVE